MSKISTYEVVPVPKLADKLIGTSVGGEIENRTYNFSLQELLTLFLPFIPANNLQGILDYGNTATQNINLFGTITTTNLETTDTANLFITYLNEETHIVGSVFDSVDSVGTAGQVLTSTGDGVEWYTLPPIFTPNLQQVLEVGNTANIDIVLDSNLQANSIYADDASITTQLTIQGVVMDYNESVGSAGQVLSSTATTVEWVSLPVYSATSPLLFNSSTGVFSIKVANSTQGGYLTANDWVTFNGKQNAGNYITSLIGEATGTGPGATSVTLTNSAVIGKLLVGLNITGGTISSSDSILTAFGKLQNQINGLVGGVQYQGVWNALTNTPTLTSSVGNQGWYYIVNVAGATNLNGITDWQVGDWAIFSGGSWQKVDNTDSVTSVNGQVGAVSLTTDNIPEGSTNLYYLNSRARAALSFTAGSGAYNSTTGVITIPTNTNQLTNGASFITLGSLSASSPLSYNNLTGAFAISQSGSTTNGYLSSTDWNTFNNKQPAGSYVPTSRQLTINGTAYDLSADRSWSVGTVTSVAALTLGTIGTDLSSSIATGTTTPVITLNVPTASASNRGALSAADWSTFNTKVGSVTATSPLSSSGGSTPNITIQQSSGSQNGYLSSTDWTTFNNKQAAGNYITSLTGEATASGPGAASVTLNNASVTAKVLTGINITGGTVVSTDSILTGFGKLQNQINSLIGSTIYKGVWNASTNVPALASGVGTQGWYYIVNVAGTTNLDGITDWFVGDWAIFDGTAWQQVDNTDAVVSVNGQTGAVSLTTDNIPEGATNQYYLNSRARAALSFTAGSGAYNSTTGVITIPTNTSQLTNGAAFITLASLSATAPIGYNSSTGAISITQSGSATNGYLSSTDWNTFNNKQAALTNPVTGTGTTNYLPKFTGASTIGNSLLYDNGTTVQSNGRVGILTTPSSTYSLKVRQANFEGIQIEEYSYPTNYYTYFQSFYNNSTWSVNSYFANIGGTGYTSDGTGTLGSSIVLSGSTGDITFYTAQAGTAGTLAPYLTPIIIKNGGNVLIGTTTDAGYKLDVNGTGRFSGDLTISKTSPLTIYNRTATNQYSGLQLQTSGTNNFGVGLAWNGASTNFEIYNYGTATTGLKIAYADNAVTLTGALTGTSATFSSSVSAATNFRLNGADFSQVAILDNGGGFAGGYNFNINSTTAQHNSTGAASGYWYKSDGSVNFYSDASAASGTSLTTRLTIASTGAATFSSSVTANPTSGNGFVASASTGTNDIRYKLQNSIGSSYFGIDNSTGSVFGNGAYTTNIYTDNATPIVLSTNAVARLYVGSTGNVGIGTTSPITKLHVDKASQTIGGTTPNGGLVVTGLAGGNYALELGTDAALVPYIQSRNAISATYYPLALNPSGGNVGIGTTNPASLPYGGGGIFAVYQSGSSAFWLGGNQLCFDGQGTARDLNFYFRYSLSATLQTDSYFKFNINSSTAMTIASTSNVLIGTGIDNGQKLQIQGNVRFNYSDNFGYFGLGYISGADYGIYNYNYGRADLLFTQSTGAATFSSSVDVNSYIRNTNSGADNSVTIANDGSNAYIQSNNAARTGYKNLLLNPYGSNVGIGTTSPSVKLQVDNNTHNYFQLNSTVANVQTSISAQNTSSNKRATLSWEDGTRGDFADLYSSTYTTFTTGSTEKMRLFSDGNLGLGTSTNAGYKLDVNGTGRFSGQLTGTSAIFNTGSSVTPNFIVYGGGNSTGGGKGNIRSSDAGGGNYWDFGRDNAVTGDFVISNFGASPFFRLATLTGAATFSSSVKTGALAGGYSAGAWKFGTKFTTTTAHDATGYITLDIDGTTYYLALATPL